MLFKLLFNALIELLKKYAKETIIKNNASQTIRTSCVLYLRIEIRTKKKSNNRTTSVNNNITLSRFLIINATPLLLHQMLP